MATAPPTGCYKCGRPGHWSRDCPDSTDANTDPKTSQSVPSTTNTIPSKEKPKKVPRSRPKLTPEILLAADHGLPFILRHFPRNFKYRGHRHEVSDLGNLIGLYSQWHSRLLPYYSFNQFVHKVEQVAASKRVKMCIRDLRERVARGVDPTKLPESETEYADADVEPALNSEELHQMGDPFLETNDAEVIQEDILQDIYDGATREESLDPHTSSDAQKQNNGTSNSSEVLITEEQRARMEANRLKALERAAARSSSLRST